jgi:rod shape-determining protein MreC
MQKRTSWISKLANLVIFVLLEMTAFQMVYSNAPLQRSWAAHSAHVFMDKVWGGSNYIGYYFQLRGVNEQLAQENFALTEELFQAREQLRKAHVDTMALDNRPGFSTLAAEVVKMSHNGQHNYLILNKGYEDGVQEKSGVVTHNGVVGIVDAVSAHHAFAFSFQNNDISISARLGLEGGSGLLVWDGVSSGKAVLKEIPLQYKYQPGDTVFTSGHSLLFPPDIPLGIAGGSRVINGSTNEIEVKLFQDFGSIRYVTVVHNNSFDEIEQFVQ